MIKDEIRQQFDELLPWYVNGTLEDGDRQWVEGERLPGDHAIVGRRAARSSS